MDSGIRPSVRARLSMETGGELSPAQVPSPTPSAPGTVEGIKTNPSQLPPVPRTLHSPQCRTSTSLWLSPKEILGSNSQGRTAAETGSNMAESETNQESTPHRGACA